jgi:dipeptidyl aminopeptidase/acylaminoacyl peptidase
MRIVALVLAIAGAAWSCAAARTLQTPDIARIADLEQPAISPNGDRVAFLVVRPNVKKASYDRELRTIDIADGRQQVLVRGGDVTLPRWSPDGAQLAYLQRNGDRVVLMLWNSGKPRVVARADGDVNDFAWRRDGRAIAFSAYDAASKSDYFEAGDNDYTQTSITPPVHLWLVAPNGTDLRRLTHGAWTIAPTDATGMFASEFTWSPDGRRIVFTKLPNTFSGDNENSTLQTLDVSTGVIAKLTAHPAVELAPQFSPDGGTLAYWYPQDGNFLAQNTLRVLSGGTDAAATRDFDRDIGGTLWMPGGRAMFACGNDGTHSRAYVIPIGGRPQVVDLGGLEITCDAYQSSTFDAGIAASFDGRGAIAFLATDARHVRELYYRSAGGGEPRRLTHFNDWVDGITLGKIEGVQWDGPNGVREYGVVHYPPNARPGSRYPIVVDIHGGPGLAEIESLAGKSYGGDWPIEQLIAARGYIVFAPNYRGSDNAGNGFLLSIVGDPVKGPAADIMSGLEAVKALPMADGSRTAVCGWSYGGLMTSWLIGQYHDWKAAVSGAAVNVESQSYDLSVSNVQDRYYQGGITPYLNDGLKHYQAVSPITYASSITTPTLIWGTTRDPVVPVTMSYALFHAMRDNGKTVKFVVFDASTHGPDTPLKTAELTDLWLGWLDRYVKGSR